VDDKDLEEIVESGERMPPAMWEQEGLSGDGSGIAIFDGEKVVVTADEE
jgi:hypothetical protein